MLKKADFDSFIQGQIWYAKNEEHPEITICEIVNRDDGYCVMYCCLGQYKNISAFMPLGIDLFKEYVGKLQGFAEELPEYEPGFNVWAKVGYPHYKADITPEKLIEEMQEKVEQYLSDKTKYPKINPETGELEGE